MPDEALACYKAKGDTAQAICHALSGIPAQVTSANYAVVASLSNTIESLGLEACWPSLAPSRYGNHAAVDAAVLAVIDAANYRMQDPLVRDERLLVTKATASYGKAIFQLQKSLNNPTEQLADSTILAIGLLSLHDFLTSNLASEGSANSSTHFSAIERILLARPRTHQHSDLTRAMVSRMWLQTFYIPMVSNEASPFDSPDWLDIDPVRVWTLSPGIASLHKISYQLFIRLPRFIAGVRALREGHASADEPATLKLAQALLDMRDEAAETEVLHRLKVIRSSDEVCRRLVPYSFEFASLDEMRAAINYWQTRLLVFRLCLVLGITEVNGKPIRAEQARLMVNLVMAWQYAFAMNAFDHALAHAAFVVWAALVGQERFKGLSIQETRYWILQCLKRSSVGWTKELAVWEIDMMVESLAGGPIIVASDKALYTAHCSVPEIGHNLYFQPERHDLATSALLMTNEAVEARSIARTEEDCKPCLKETRKRKSKYSDDELSDRPTKMELLSRSQFTAGGYISPYQLVD